MLSRKTFLTGLVAAVGLFLAAPAQAAESTLQNILTRGEIIIGTDIPYEPFEFLDVPGSTVGAAHPMIRSRAWRAFSMSSASL